MVYTNVKAFRKEQLDTSKDFYLTDNFIHREMAVDIVQKMDIADLKKMFAIVKTDSKTEVKDVIFECCCIVK